MSVRIASRVAAGLLLALLTCRPADPAGEASPAPRWFDDPPREVPRIGAGGTDALPQDVGALAADDSLIYLLDRERGDVVALDIRSARRRWRWAGSRVADSSRGAQMPASALSISPQGVVVARQDGSALVELDRRGRTIHSMDLDRREFLFGLCAMNAGQALIATARSAAPWRIVAPGAQARVVSPPWPGAAGRSAVAWQGALTPLPDGRGCAMALSVGPGFAVIAPDGSVRAAPYVEPIAPPRLADHRIQQDGRAGTVRKLESPTIAATGAAVRGDTLFVAFAGASPDRGRLIDRYLWRSGQYAGSLRLAAPVARIAIAGDRLLAVRDANGRATLHVFDRRSRRSTAPLSSAPPHGRPALGKAARGS